MNDIEKAMKVITDAFKEDPDFRHGYVANVAMLLCDKHGIEGYDERNAAAEDIINLVFWKPKVEANL